MLLEECLIRPSSSQDNTLLDFFFWEKKYNSECFYLLVHTYVEKRSLLFIANNSVGNGSVTYPNRRNSAIKNPPELSK